MLSYFVIVLDYGAIREHIPYVDPRTLVQTGDSVLPFTFQRRGFDTGFAVTFGHIDVECVAFPLDATIDAQLQLSAVPGFMMAATLHKT
uniref:Uncharacterized protein n=1 Tax=Romanomermis culicivorax TaxID=13658 RepID=A0A915JU02_ROMCU